MEPNKEDDMKKHFVIFMSPGTFVAEQTEKPIASWNVKKAVEMSKKIIERYNAKPYGFYFTTRERKDNELDSKVVKSSGMYYLGGKIITLEELKARKSPNDSTLISNMECNDWDKVVETNNSWRWIQPLRKGDKIVEL
jgi:hypothetical protein